MDTLPGAAGDQPNPPSLIGSTPPGSAAPLWWADEDRVIRVVLDMWDKDPDGATALWESYRLRKKQ